MYKLYDFLPSGNGYKVRLLLTQLQIPFELIQLNILDRETRTPEYLAKNPNGKIPLLEIARQRVAKPVRCGGSPHLRNWREVPSVQPAKQAKSCRGMTMAHTRRATVDSSIPLRLSATRGLEEGAIDTYISESNAILYYLSQETEYFPLDKCQQAKVMQWLFFEQYSHEPNIATPRY